MAVPGFVKRITTAYANHWKTTGSAAHTNIGSQTNAQCEHRGTPEAKTKSADALVSETQRNV